MSAHELPGYARAQREWEAMEPPRGGPCDCPDCHGYGYAIDADTDIECAACHGFGMIDENGEPFDPDAAEYAACEYADFKREENRNV